MKRAHLKSKIIFLIFLIPFFIQSCTAWPGFTAVLGLLGGKSGSAPLFFLPSSGSKPSPPEPGTPPDTTLDPSSSAPIQLTGLQIETNSFQVPKGAHIDLKAIAIYSNNLNNDVTDVATWNSEDSNILEPQTVPLVPGRFIGKNTGTVKVTASFQSFTAEVTITVTPAILEKIELFPTNIQVVKSMTTTFSVTGIYTDGSHIDLTDHVNTNYQITPSIATANHPSTGLIYGNNTGSATITVTHTTSYGTFVDSGTVTVNNPQLLSISITPNTSQSIPLGLYIDFTAIGHYENGDNIDITNDVTWVSSDSSVGVFYGSPYPAGRLSSLQMGTTNVTAQVGSVSSSPVDVTVTQKQLVSITVNPSSSSSPVGIPIDFNAIGTFTDNSNETITNLVTWSSSNNTVATVNNSTNPGRATGHQVGTVTITATYSSFSGTATFQVTSAILVSLSIVPTNSQTVAGEFRNFSAIGTLSDNSNSDFTENVTWSVDNESLATISNAIGTRGRMQAIAAGTVNITATHSSGVNNTISAIILAADTTPPTIISATSLSPNTVEVRFDEPMNQTDATNPANYKVVLTSSLTGLQCSDNSNFTSSTSALSITSVTGSGDTFILHLASDQGFGVNYTVVGNRSALRDQATTPNYLGCSNFASFEGKAKLRVTGASCRSLTSLVLNFSKPVVLGNATGSAECNSVAECSQKYKIDPLLGQVTSAKALDGTICGGLPASQSRICITHDLLQSGTNYTILAANGIDGDGFNDLAYGAIRSQDNEDLEPNPRDRALFTGCGVVPTNFADGPISTNPFGDNSSFGFLTAYNNRIYVGPNEKGNSASRFNFDGTNPESISFLIEKRSTHSNTATTRDGGIPIPPFVTMGHTGCTLNNADLTIGCGPDNENGRGNFTKIELFGQEFLIMGGSRNVNPSSKWKYYDYIYITSSTSNSLNFNWIFLGNITGDSTEGVQSFVSHNNRLYMGFAKLNEPFNCTGMPSPCNNAQLSRNTPDFGVVFFKTGPTDGTACGLNQNCEATDGTRGRRFRIDALDYFGGTNANANKTETDNWGRYVGVDSLFVFRDRVYGANGGHHKIDHNGSIMRSDTLNPNNCNPFTNDCSGNFVEIGPRNHPFWHGTGANLNKWYSLELRKAADFTPADHAFAQFTEYKGNLYVTRTICVTNESTANTHADTFYLPPVAGCNDGTFTNRRPQLWRCIPETTGDPNTCEPGDWDVIADNGTGISNFGNVSNHSATMVVANGNYLYYGMDNENGVEIWRTNVNVPGSSTAVWEKINTNGFGDPNMRSIFSAISVPVGSQHFLYVSTGNNGVPLKIFRQQNN